MSKLYFCFFTPGSIRTRNMCKSRNNKTKKLNFCMHCPSLFEKTLTCLYQRQSLMLRSLRNFFSLFLSPFKKNTDILGEKSRIREILNLLNNKDSSTNTKTDRKEIYIKVWSSTRKCVSPPWRKYQNWMWFFGTFLVQ